jgi:hypothetical protein
MAQHTPEPMERIGERIAWAGLTNPRRDAAGNKPRDPGDENAGWREAYFEDVTFLKAQNAAALDLLEALREIADPSTLYCDGYGIARAALARAGL